VLKRTKNSNELQTSEKKVYPYGSPTMAVWLQAVVLASIVPVNDVRHVGGISSLPYPSLPAGTAAAADNERLDRIRNVKMKMM